MENITFYKYQEKLLDSLKSNQKNIIYSSRQMGISTVLSIYIAKLISEGKNVGIFSHKEMISIELLNKIKDYILKKIDFKEVKYNNRTTLELKNGGKVKIL